MTCKRESPFGNVDENSPAKTDTKMSQVIGYFLCGIQAIATIVFLYAVFHSNMLPMKYLVAIVGILIVLLGFCTIGTFVSKKNAIAIKTISVITTIMLVIGSAYMFKIIASLDKISSIDVKLDSMVVAVSATDPAEDILDTADYIFATEIPDGTIGKYNSIMIEEIQAHLGTDIAVAEYETLNDQILALENGEVDAIIYSEAYQSIVEEENPDFGESIKIIFEHGIEVEIEKDEAALEVEVKDDVYSVYISGIDVYGDIAKTSRSDVNIIATINPNTEQILLVTTPRDYYVQIPGISGAQRDKLTHAGIYGVTASIDTLEALYEVDLDFYARVNFTSLINMVDALGGITVYSNQSFTAFKNMGSYTVQEGYNDFDGEDALIFSRERKQLDGGDCQRGKNQQEVMRSMIEKATSSAIIANAYEILDSVSDNIDTNMSKSQIQDLIKKQIDEGTDWDIITMSAIGIEGSDSCYSSGDQKLFVFYPIEESVQEIRQAIQAIYNGERLTQE